VAPVAQAVDTAGQADRILARLDDVAAVDPNRRRTRKTQLLGLGVRLDLAHADSARVEPVRIELCAQIGERLVG
jgi:hypothetical protein